MDWRALFKHYEATVDAPCCAYYEELLQAFPDAKVLLNVRDPERWYDSLCTLYAMRSAFRWLRFFVPRMRKFYRFGDLVMAKVLGTDWRDREGCLRQFNEHIEEVKRVVPAEKLLLFRVADGWEPLCRFLGCEVPHVPFPHLNEGGDTVRSLLRRMLPFRNRSSA